MDVAIIELKDSHYDSDSAYRGNRSFYFGHLDEYGLTRPFDGSVPRGPWGGGGGRLDLYLIRPLSKRALR